MTEMPLHILLAEDNDGDVLLVREALREHHVDHQLMVVHDGLQAERYFARLGCPGDTPCPDIVLLDLNLPHRDGHELLQLFRAHPHCGNKPVIIVTSSGAERDRRKAIELGATRFFEKPSDVDEFIQLGALVREVAKVMLPERGTNS